MGCTQGKLDAKVASPRPEIRDPTDSEIEEEERIRKETAERSAQKKREKDKLRNDVKKLVTDPLGKDKLWEEVEEAFKKFDLDWDGRLSAQEAKKYIEDWAAKRMDREDAKEVATFDDIDTNKDGYIDKQELYEFIRTQRMLHSELF